MNRNQLALPSVVAAGLFLGVLASPAQALLVSLDAVWNTPATSTISGDTTLAAGPKENTSGLSFTGQSGFWNTFNIGPFGNQNIGSVTSGFLNDGTGAPTTIRFGISTTYRAGTNGVGFPGAGANLREEIAYLYPNVLTGTTMSWSITGLTPGGLYSLIAFGEGGDSNIANAVAGVKDAEGDWNWASIAANGSGVISGVLTSATTVGPGFYGIQLQSAPAATIPEPATALLAVGGLACFTVRPRRQRDAIRN